jgi:hypothetical protein
MKLYLNERLESFYVLRLTDLLLSELMMDPELVRISDIYKVQRVQDPVYDFLDYYSQSSSIHLSDERKQYIKNSLYAVKGAPQVIELLGRLLDLRVIYTYNFPVLDIIDFDSLQISDIITFTRKLKELLYHLLYYTTLNIYINDLILLLQGNLIDYSTYTYKGFYNINLEIHDTQF